MTREERKRLKELQKEAYTNEIKRLQKIFEENDIHEEIKSLDINYNKSLSLRSVTVVLKSKYKTFRDINNRTINKYCFVHCLGEIYNKNGISYHPIISAGQVEDRSDFLDFDKIKTILLNEYYIWILSVDRQINNWKKLCNQCNYNDITTQEYYNMYKRYQIVMSDTHPITYSPEALIENFKRQIKDNLIIMDYQDFELNGTWSDDLVTDEVLYNVNRYMFF